MELSTGRGTVVPYIVRLRRSDGTMLNLPETFPGATPPPQAEVPIRVDGELVLARVEGHSQWHTKSPDTHVHPIDVVIASQMDSKPMSSEMRTNLSPSAKAQTRES
jgi:hypothetical protein